MDMDSWRFKIQEFAYIVVGLTAVAASAIFLLIPQNAGRRGR